MRRAPGLLVAVGLLGLLSSCDEQQPARPHPLEAKLKERVDSARKGSPPPAPAPAPTPAVAPQAVAPMPPAPARARRGDFVEYRLGMHRRSRGWREVQAAAVVRLQAIEVTEAMTRVHVSSPDVPGWFCGGVVFELHHEGSRARRAPAVGASPSTVRVGDRDVECFTLESDASAADGPRISECGHSPDGALALGDGLVLRRVSQAGPGASGGQELELLRAGHEATLPVPAPVAFPRGASAWRTRTGSEWRHAVVSAGGLLKDEASSGSTYTLLEYLLLHLEDAALPAIPPDAERLELTLGAHRVAAARVRVQESTGEEFGSRGSPGTVSVEYLLPVAPRELVAPWPVRCGALAVTRGKTELYRVLDWD